MKLVINYYSEDLISKEVAIGIIKFSNPLYRQIRGDVKRLNKALRRKHIKIDYGFRTVFCPGEDEENIDVCNFCVIPLQRIKYKDGTKYGREGVRFIFITHLKKRKYKFTFLDLNDLILAKDEWIIKYLGLDYDHDKKYYKYLKQAMKHCIRHPVLKKKLVIDLTKEAIVEDSENQDQDANINPEKAADHLLDEIVSLYKEGKLEIKSESKRGKKPTGGDTEAQKSDSVYNSHVFGWYSEKEFMVKSTWIKEFMEQHSYNQNTVLELLRNDDIIQVDISYKGKPNERIRYFLKRTVCGIPNVEYLHVRRNEMKPENIKVALETDDAKII